MRPVSVVEVWEGFQEVLVGLAPVVLGDLDLGGLVGLDLDLLHPLGEELVVPG